MGMRNRLFFLFVLPIALWGAPEWLLVRTVDGTVVEGQAQLKSVKVDGTDVALAQVLSIHSGGPASTFETERITQGMAAIQGEDRAARDKAVEELTSIGIPVMTPLLKGYKDTDQHEPRPLYRLFERLMPSYADAFDRTLSMVRLKNGRKFKVRLPTGLQTGDVVRFGAKGEHRLTIAVENLEKVELKGADLWIVVGVSREFLRDGGRIELDTPLGPRKFWVSRTSAARGLYRAPGEGLPARGERERERGHLFVKFEADESLDERPAKSLLARFAKVWAAE